ncbi:MAG TPA: secretin and TonB N-terminal domain-containing protein, partial [Thermoanaerobaculia bacterium]|nr:secretin and TonB N-terminal domain-containing protein [Thermoanaerobaculia bacterium]
AAPAAEPPVPQHTVVVRPPGAAPRQRTAPLHPVEKIDLSLRDADLVEVLRSFAVLGGFDLVVDPGVAGTVTVELKDVEWPLALAAILRTHGLAAEIDGRVVGVRPLPGLPPR